MRICRFFLPVKFATTVLALLYLFFHFRMFIIHKLTPILTVVLTLAHLSLQQQQVIDDYDVDVDHCNFYDTDLAECHHDTFRTSPTLESKYGQNVKKCCKGHSYKFHDNCEVGEDK